MSERHLRRRPPAHPLLFAIYPVLFLYGQNLGEVTLGDLVAPIAIVVVASLVVYAVARLVLRTSGRAALATSLLVVTFFAYGRVLDAVAGSPIGGGRLLVVAGVVVVLGMAAILLVKRDPARLNRGLDLVGTILTIVAIVGIVSYELPRALRPAGAPAPVNNVTATETTTRDIYYIVVEDLGSPKVLEDHFGLTDPHAFDWLTELGFQVPADSDTNYGKTIHMLASTMNMEYLDDLAASVGPESSDYHPLYRLVDDNAAARFLKAQGYRYLHIGSWWDPTEKSSIADVNYGISAPSDFTEALVKTTMLPEITSRLPRIGIHLPAAVELSGEGAQFDGAVFGFQKLKDLAPAPGPKFVFAHFLVPHDPYVFTEDGKRLTPQARDGLTRKQAFLGQAMYVNHQLEAIARALLSGPEATRPIVIIQTDEGPNPPGLDDDAETFSWTAASQEDLEIKYPVLNAFYLPGVTDSKVYDGMSTVNTFRLLFSTYFGADLPLLPDRQYIYRDKAHPYAFTDITDRLRH
jgi:hypothetical protein